MKTLVSVLALLISLNTLAKESFLYMQKDVAQIVEKDLGVKFSKKSLDKKNYLLKVKEKDVEKISGSIHSKLHNCGGFFNFDSEEEANRYIADMHKNKKASSARNLIFLKELDLEKTRKGITKAVDEVQEIKIREMIEKLSSFKTRFYQSETGVEAAEYIAKKWKSIIKNRTDASVALFEHSWKQPSVILRIEGETKDAIVLGGHLDSVVQKGLIIPRIDPHAVSPGADDNASGIATITEVLRVIVEKNFKPKRTIFFMGYAAEEVGLKGSKEIAKVFTKNDFGYNVQAAIQFDMTNFKGSSKEMYLISDEKHTNKELTNYLGSLIDRYVKVEWGVSKCGYACSDHASWNNAGVPAAFPFEASFKGANKKIHSSHDTIEQSNGVADHAVNFAKLGVAYAMDLSKK